MLRRAAIALSLFAFGLSLVGCGGSDTSAQNPNNLPYSKEGPPKRGNPPPIKGK